MKLDELQKWQNEWKLEDTWWMSLGGKVSGPLSLMDVAQEAQNHPKVYISVMHTCFSECATPAWQVFTRDGDDPSNGTPPDMKRTTMRLSIRKTLTTSRMIQLKPKSPASKKR